MTLTVGTIQDYANSESTVEGTLALSTIVEFDKAATHGFYRYDSKDDPETEELANTFIQNHGYIMNPLGAVYDSKPIRFLHHRQENEPLLVPAKAKGKENLKIAGWFEIYGLLYTNGMVTRIHGGIFDTENRPAELPYKQVVRLWIKKDTAKTFSYPLPSMTKPSHQ